VSAPARSAVCVLAPPQAGKTTGVVMPSVAAAPGAVIVTSIKRDVLDATAAVRARAGRCWLFDPSGREIAPPGVQLVRWSPVASARSWDDSRIVARSMVAAALSVTTGPAGPGSNGAEAHFMDKATDTLSPMLYAAFHAGRSMVDVSDWLYQADPTIALDLLAHQAAAGSEGAGGARIAWQVLGSVDQLADRERSSVYSTAQRVVTAYVMEGVRGLVTDPNFDPAAFVTSADTLYVVGGIDVQAAAAPVVVALLTAITTAVYQRQRAVSAGLAPPGIPVQMILDEAANIAPIAELPQWLSTAGGNGLHLVVVFQDLSQVAARWGRHIAAGILTLCATRLVLGGIADPDTLTALSNFIGAYDRATGPPPPAPAPAPNANRSSNPARSPRYLAVTPCSPTAPATASDPRPLVGHPLPLAPPPNRHHPTPRPATLPAYLTRAQQQDPHRALRLPGDSGPRSSFAVR
jgi:type IV secretion system protein VirD4